MKWCDAVELRYHYNSVYFTIPACSKVSYCLYYAYTTAAGQCLEFLFIYLLLFKEQDIIHFFTYTSYIYSNVVECLRDKLVPVSLVTKNSLLNSLFCSLSWK